MVKQAGAHIRWRPAEYLKIAANALQYIDAGAALPVALYRAQKLATESDRWVDLERITRLSAFNGVGARYVSEARGLPMHQLAVLITPASPASLKSATPKVVKPAPAVAAEAPAPVRRFGRWDQHIQSLIAHEVQRLQAIRARPLRTLYKLAQADLLPEEFRYTGGTINGIAGRHELEAMYARGLSRYPEFIGKRLPWAVDEPAAVPPPAAAVPPPPSDGRVRFRDLDVKAFSRPADVGRNVKWTTLEKAKFARAWDRVDLEGASLSNAGFVIQMHSGISPDRWRPKRSFIDLVLGKDLDRLLIEGRNNRWLLQDLEPAPAPAPAPAEVEAVQGTALETAPAVQAPIPLPAPSASLAAAAAAFGTTVQQGLHLLLEAHAHHVLSAYDAKISAIAQAVGSSIAAQIEQTMRKTVLDTMAAELGGPVAAPPAAPAPVAIAPSQEAAPSFPERPPAPPPPASGAVNSWQAQQAAAPLAAIKPEPVEPEALRKTPHIPAGQDNEARPKQLRVDVVGLTGNNIQLVRDAFNGNTDIKFIDPDHLNEWAPHRGRYAVLATKWVPHKAKEKCRSAKVRVINVTGSVGTVIHTIEELHRSKGIPQ